MSTTATVAITVKETNDFPPRLFPLSGSVCRGAGPTRTGMVVTAVDEDLPPHAAPFIFEMPDELSINWTVIRVNGERRQPMVQMEKVELFCIKDVLAVFTTSLLTFWFPPFIFFPTSDTHAALQPRVELEAGEYALTVNVSDSGSPALSAYSQVNVTVCLCDSYGDCKSETGAFSGSSVGISFFAVIIVMASVALLLCKPS